MYVYGKRNDEYASAFRMKAQIEEAMKQNSELNAIFS